MKVSFVCNVGATGSLCDWLQNFEIEGLILWLEICKILQLIKKIKVGLGHASAQIKKLWMINCKLLCYIPASKQKEKNNNCNFLVITSAWYQFFLKLKIQSSTRCYTQENHVQLMHKRFG